MLSMTAGARGTCGLLPAAPGVYRFRDARGRVLYVGRASNLRTRTQSYWGDLAGRAHLRRMTPQIEAVEALVCGSPHEAAWLERNLLERALPRWNRVRGGLEVPIWLVLDPGPRAPDLTVAHEPSLTAVNLGPFLGADRARLVRSGLLRVWPLPLTGAALGGSEREMARVRGVDPADRARLVTVIQAALAGEPDALAAWREGLLAARERSVASLAFEQAQQVSDELAAIDWAIGIQRVTGPAQVDLDVVGWCEGVLVRLAIRGGRMQHWEQRLAEREPRALLQRTAPQWR
ncbi:MAG TPA: GIY-YIG nuclease family protein, partial [Candidatus Nanopelagicales bacterium]